MDLRRAFFSRSMRLINHPAVARALRDPRALDAFVALVRAKERGAALVHRVWRRVVARAPAKSSASA